MLEAIELVDAHHHFWDLKRNYYPWLCDQQLIPFRYGDYSRIRRNYLPEDYERDVGKHRVIASVHIEADHDHTDPVRETLWLEEVQVKHGRPNVCVAFAALDSDDAADVLARQAARPIVRGIRHKLNGSPSPDTAVRNAPGSLDDPRWRRGFALLNDHGLTFDLQTEWWHMDAVSDLAKDFRETPIVINHSGLPADRSPEALACWRRAMEQVAQNDNVFVKISGLGLPGRAWTLESNGPIIRALIEVFGVDRCMFASNYPVDSICGTYDEIVAAFWGSIKHLSGADRKKILRDNALHFYRIGI